MRGSVLMIAVCAGAPVTFSNVAARRDVTGKIMDAHDGSIRQFPASGTKLWYYHAMGYGLCKENGESATACGTSFNNTINLWTSPDLQQWTFVGDMLPRETRPNCTYFRSHAVYNPNTKKYVLFTNAQKCPSFCGKGAGGACYLTATSDRPEGPFDIQGTVQTKFTQEGGVGDQSLFVDDDVNNTAYLIHKRTGRAPPGQKHRILIEKLTPDYLLSTNETLGTFGDSFVEAPAMVKRKGVYYAFFGKCCAFCKQGSGIGIYTATTPLGPYTKRGNIGCAAPTLPGCGCGGAHDPDMRCPKDVPSVTHAQQNFVIEIPAKAANETPSFVWTGDQWQSACTVPGLDCVKGWDLQYWSPLTFNESLDPPMPVQLHWQDTVEIPVAL